MYARHVLWLLRPAVLLSSVVTPLAAQPTTAPAATVQPESDDAHVAEAVFRNIV